MTQAAPQPSSRAHDEPIVVPIERVQGRNGERVDADSIIGNATLHPEEPTTLYVRLDSQSNLAFWLTFEIPLVSPLDS